MYKDNWTQPWPMGSKIFSSSSPILLEPLAYGSSDWSLPREDCITPCSSIFLTLSQLNLILICGNLSLLIHLPFSFFHQLTLLYTRMFNLLSHHKCNLLIYTNVDKDLLPYLHHIPCDG